jgi:oligoendopeptidase F
MGIDLTQQDNIDLDVEDRPEKEPRPACYMIAVPDDIRVLVKPLGGAEDYESLFHEIGHAEHYAHVQATDYEFRILGEDGVTESFAFLFENLFMDPKFLETKANMPADVARSYVRQGLMADLSSLRYYCALFLFERALHSGAEDPSWIYRDFWERARLTRMSLPQAEAGYLMANEDFYSVGYLEAWLLEAQLREKLRQDYGAYWFSDPRAGQLLKDLWALGSEKPVGELAQELGYGSLDAGPLRRETERLFHYARGTSPLMDRETAGRM